MEKLKIFKNKTLNTEPISTSENIIKDEKRKNEALDKISPSWVPSNPDFLPDCSENEFFDIQFDFLEFNNALETKKDKSSCGPDGIDYCVLKNLPIKYKLILVDIFNDIYSTQDFPLTWSQSYVHLIKKSNGAYRPISLTCCSCKIFETLLKNRLQWWCEHNNLLPQSQTGFRKGQSCANNLSDLTLYIDEGFQNKQDILATFLDVQGAFDNVNCEILLSILASIGCSKKLIIFIQFLLYKRNILTDLSDEERLTFKGVPQGGVLSPLLYIIYVSKIVDNLQKRIYVRQFADDIAIFIKSKSTKRKSTIQNAIIKVKDNLRSLGLELCAEKTVLIHFSRNKCPPGETQINIENIVIKSSPSTKFLGIIFDHKLTFTPHLNYVQGKCNKAINILKFLCGKWWGSDPETLLTLYKSYVRPHIDYGSFIYFPKRKNAIEKLEKIQLQAIKIALGYRKSTPSNIVLSESKLQTIEQRSKYLGKYFVTKNLSNSKLMSCKSIENFHKNTKKIKLKKKRMLQNIIEEIITETKKNLIKNTDFILYSLDFNINKLHIPVDINLAIELQKSIDPNYLFDNYLKNKNATTIHSVVTKTHLRNTIDCAYICDQLNFSKTVSLSRKVSNLTAECFSLSEAVEFAIQNPNCDFIITSNSRRALLLLNSEQINIKSNPYLLNTIKNINKFLKLMKNKIEFVWIPSCLELRIHKKLDNLAKSVSFQTPTQDILIPYTDYRKIYLDTASNNTESENRAQGQKKVKSSSLSM